MVQVRRFSIVFFFWSLLYIFYGPLDQGLVLSVTILTRHFFKSCLSGQMRKRKIVEHVALQIFTYSMFYYKTYISVS